MDTTNVYVAFNAIMYAVIYIYFKSLLYITVFSYHPGEADTPRGVMDVVLYNNWGMAVVGIVSRYVSGQITHLYFKLPYYCRLPFQMAMVNCQFSF